MGVKSKDSTQRPRPDSNRGPFDPKSDAVTDWPLRSNYSLGTNSTVKPFKQLGVAKSTVYKVLQNLENRGATENKQLATGRSAVKLTKGKRKQPVNAAMDNDPLSLTRFAKKVGVHQIYV